jgi:hypothetical protein
VKGFFGQQEVLDVREKGFVLVGMLRRTARYLRASVLDLTEVVVTCIRRAK